MNVRLVFVFTFHLQRLRTLNSGRDLFNSYLIVALLPNVVLHAIHVFSPEFK